MRTPLLKLCRRAPLLLAMLAVPGRAEPTATVDDDGHFAATFPAEVSRSNQILDTDAGQIIMCKANAAQAGASFVVIYCDYPEGYVAGTGAPGIFKAAAKDAADQAKGSVRSQSDCKLGDVAGVEVLIDGPNKGFVERIRLFAVGDRLFQVQYRGRPGSETGKDALGFLDSFRLLPVPAPR